MKRSSKIRAALALILPVLMMNSSASGADQQTPPTAAAEPGIKASLDSILGEWTSRKIEKIKPEGFGFIGERDEVNMKLKPDGTCDWQFHIKQADKKPTMTTKFMIGTGHIAFVEGGLIMKGDIQLWKFQVKEDELILETEPAGLKITLKRNKN